MLKTFLFLLICFEFVACWSQSKLTLYAKEITETLCAPALHGRGYVNDGCNKAGEFLSGEFERIGLQPFNGYNKQSFYLGVNTFPGNCKLRYKGRKKKPGIEYLIHPSSAPFHGKISLIPLNAKQILEYPYKKHAQGWGLAFVQPKVIAKDTLNMVRAKLEKLARIQMPVIEFTRDKLTWSVSSEQFKFPYIQVFDTTGKSLPNKINLNIDAFYRTDVEVSNIIGLVESKQPSDSFIIVSAHYDHLGQMGKKTYFPGANDNASGVAMMLSLAKEIQQQPLPKHNVLFVAFAGEEIGLEGSQFFVSQNLVGKEQISLVLNLDIMGSGEEGITVVNGAIHKPIYQRLVELNESTESVKAIKARGKAANSDHYPFSEVGIPAIFIYTMGPNKNYHDIHDKSDALTFDRFDQLHYLLLRFLQTF